jgi:ABC-2 type transport system ATP-binding protein
VEKICDRVGVIKDGKLIQVSPIETLRKSTVKRVRATVQEPFESRSKHIKDLSVDGAHVSFVYTGPVKQLLKVLEAQTLQDVTIEDPSLEEIFMHVYERSAA